MRGFITLCAALLVLGCKNGKRTPDVSGIQLNLTVYRFEKDLFALDTLHLDHSLQQLSGKYPGFTQDFLFNILGTTPDSVYKDLPFFIRSYQSLATAAAAKFGNFQAIEVQVKQGLRLVHYYFPAHPLPTQLITFIGPLNSYSNIITKEALAVGLQLYMGKEYALYQDEQGQQLYPAFVSRRFDPAYIAVNCIKNIVDDLYPDKSNGRPLVEQMVESGKRLYLLDHLMPDAPDSIKTGYTQQQLENCRRNESAIWSYFVQNDLLYSTDPNNIRDYMMDGPSTTAFGEGSPGNIGQFVGRQIVSRWMEKNENTGLAELMKIPAKQLFEEAKYKPAH